MHPVAYIELISVLACLAAIVFVICGWKRPGFLRVIPILLLVLLVLMMFYGFALFLEWSGLGERFRWRFIENFTGVFIPFIWSFIFYAIVKNAVEEDIRASREHFRDLVESSSDWIWEVDAVGRYTYVSPRAEAILGYTPDEVLGKTPFDLMDPEEAERIAAIFIETVGRQGSFQDLANVHLHKDGHQVVLETNGVPIFDHRGRLTGYRGVDRDITKRLENERLQKQQQAEIDGVFRASPAGIGLVRQRKLIRGNERFFEITGHSEDELTGMDPRLLYQSEQDYRSVGEKYTEAMAKGFARIETHFVRKDQAVIYVVIYIAPLDRENAAKGFVVVIQDITTLKAARQQVLEEKTRAQTYLDVANVMILVLDTTGRVKLINKKGCEILERDADQIIGADWFKTCLPPSYRQITQNVFQRIIEGGEKLVAYFENPVLTLSGTEKLIAWHNAALHDESGRIVGVVSSGDDITESRAAEEEKRKSDQQLRVALSAAKMGTWRWEAATNRDMFDDSLKALLGLTEQQTDQEYRDLYVFAHPDDRQAAKAEFDRAICEHDTYLAHFRIVQPNGEIRWVLDQGKPFYDYNGKLEYVTGVVVDITERQKAEEEIRVSRDSLKREIELFENMFHTIPDALYIKDRDSRFTHINEALIQHIGLQNEQEAIGKTDFDIFTEAHAQPAYDDEQRIMRTGIAKIGYEEKETWPDGRVTWCLSTKMPLCDVHGNITGLLGISHDITDHKVAEQHREELMKELRFTQFAVDHVSEAAYWMGPDGKFVYVNQMACRSLGYTHEELLSMKIFDIDPAFSAEVWPEHWEKMRKERSMRFESHHKTKDGRVFPVEITANFVNYDGKEYNCAFVRNITDRKASE